MNRNRMISATEGPILKQLVLFCLPIMFGTLFQQLYNTVDVIVVGKFVGTNAIASVGGSSGMIINLVVGFFTGLTSGITVILSRMAGARDSEGFQKGVGTSVLLALIGGIIFSILGLIFAPVILKLLDTPQEILVDSEVYTRIYFSGIVFVFLFNSGSAILRSMGDTGRPLVYLIVCCFVNIVLDVFLVTVVGMGVSGVAIATVTAQAVSVILTMRALMNLPEGMSLAAKYMKIDTGILKDILKIGLPASFQSIMNSLSGIVMVTAINNLGTVAVSGNTAYAKLDGIYWMIATAFSVSIATFVGQNYGAGNYERMKKCVRICLIVNVMVSACVSIFFITMAHPLLYLFTNDEEVIEQGIQVMRAIAPYYAITPFYEILISSLRAMGDSLKPMIVNVAGLCGIRILWIKVILALHPQWKGIYWIVLSCPVSWGLTALVMIFYYIYMVHHKNIYLSNLTTTVAG